MHWIVSLQQPWELGPPGQQAFTAIAVDPANRDVSSQVVAILMTSFGMLMHPPHAGFPRMCPQKRSRVPDNFWIGGKSPNHSPTNGMLTTWPSPTRPCAEQPVKRSTKRARRPFCGNLLDPSIMKPWRLVCGLASVSDSEIMHSLNLPAPNRWEKACVDLISRCCSRPASAGAISLHGYQHRSAFVLHQKHDEFCRLSFACIPANDVNVIWPFVEGLARG